MRTKYQVLCTYPAVGSSGSAPSFSSSVPSPRSSPQPLLFDTRSFSSRLHKCQPLCLPRLRPLPRSPVCTISRLWHPASPQSLSSALHKPCLPAHNRTPAPATLLLRSTTLSWRSPLFGIEGLCAAYQILL